MASSRYESVPNIVEYMRKVNPKTVLDLGVGFGKVGWLVREYLEAWNDRVTSDQWQVWITGIEVFKDYHKDGLQSIIYNHIFYENLNTIDFSGYKIHDLVTAIDVIEHLPKDNATRILNEIKTIGKNVLLSIPLGQRWLRNSYGQNPYEAHLSSWVSSEINQIGYKTLYHYRIPDGREMGLFYYEQ